MHIINQRFLRELFIEKKVSINTGMYVELYDYIWKNEDLFIGFLSHTDPSIKLDYAKRIYSFLQSNNDIFLPLSMVENIIDFQNSNLVDNIEGYIPQDHVVHCVNLYITGIYIFFNNELFNNKLIRGIDSENSPISRYRDFIDKWLLFAFYHDIGYYLEGSINTNGLYNDRCKDKIKYYESELVNEIIYLCTTRIITRLITIASVVEKSKEFFCHKKIIDFNFIGNSEDSSQLLKDYDGAVLLDDLHKFDDYSVLQHIFKYTKSVTISYDKYHKPVCIILREFGNVTHFFVVQKFKELHGYAPILENYIDIIKNLPCNHYILDISNVFSKYGETLFKELSVDFFEKLPKRLKEDFIFMPSSKQLSAFLYYTNEWLISNLKTDYLKNNIEYIRDDLLSSCYKNVFSSVFNKSIESIFNKHKNEKISSEKISAYITEVIEKTDIETIENHIQTAAKEQYENLHGAFIDIMDFGIKAYNELYEYLYNSKDNSGLIKSLQFIKKHHFNKVKIEPFIHNKKYNEAIEVKIYNKLYELSTQMKINLSDLQNYTTSYTICDHGVVSAAFLYQVITIFFHISEGYKDKMHEKFNLIWNSPQNEDFDNNEKNAKKYADVIFSILLHNIYTKSSAFYGVDYKHDIDINPFSYFSAYCDTIQKWNRPKQVDLSKTYLPDNNYLNDLFDLELKHNKIYLRCFYKDLSQMNQTLVNSEEYLPGITKFTKVLGIED